MSKTDSEATPVKKTKKQRTNAGIRMDQEMGKRWCMKCDKLIPLDLFRPNKRQYMCISHLREISIQNTLGTQEKRAFNSLRCKARSDMLLFHQEQMFMPQTLVNSMLTAEQTANFSAYSIIPKRPDQPLSEDNSIIVTSAQRIYVIAKWRTSRDPDQYECALNYILSKAQ
jgi:hypothetical protein